MEVADPDAPDRAVVGGSGETDGGSAAAHGDWSRGRIVELCSAGSVFEAHALHDALEEAGIRSQVAGDLLASSLPLGEITTPRIWVSEHDVPHAQEVVDAWTRKTRQGGGLPDEEEEPGKSEAEWEAESEAESDAWAAAPAPGSRSPWPGCALTIAGLACIIVGTIWAGHRWVALRTYSATTEGVLADYEQKFSAHAPPPPEIPLPRERTTVTTWYEVFYAFDVEGETYYSVIKTREPTPRRVAIHYDPDRPENNTVGPLASPWPILVLAVGVGASWLLAGYFLRTGRSDEETAGQFGQDAM
ncbi:MAG: DUF2007 domain-containing protein [Thermoguttaceae bacterium]|nr:DUF2007 domain-containing protein [Thermoguttaceae bacterium]